MTPTPLARASLAALALLLAAPAAAQDFAVALGEGELGRLSLRDEGDGGLALDATFADTPLGIADGTFRATSRPARLDSGEAGRQYLAESAFSSGGRTVSVLHEGGRALATEVRPEDERTELSDPALVPEGVLDPVEALARLAGATACPAPFRLYDGRRVVEVSAEPVEDGAASCRGTYRVVAGPGHLSPFRIREFEFALDYGPGGMERLEVRTGPFVLRLRR